MTHHPTESERVREFLEKWTLKAGQELKKVLREGDSILSVPTRLGRSGVVTRGDLVSEDVLVKALQREWPDIQICSEESFRVPKQGTIAYIDPLDGTVNYSRPIPYYSISIAVVIDGKSEIGIVYDVPRPTLYTAIRGDRGINIKPKFRRPKSLERRVSKKRDLSDSVLVTGWPRMEAREAERSMSFIADVVACASDVRRFGAASLDLVLVATGLVDGYWETAVGGPWDVYGGCLLVAESGGYVEIFREKRGSRFAVIATNGWLHHDLWELTKQQFANYERIEILGSLP
jgi:myo-inositol-1(or 4)-monophosphatase